MAKIIDLPKLSPTMEEGTLVRWAKTEGDNVEIDDVLAEVETDKATMEFRAFDRGTLLKRLVEEGATAKLGQPVAIFGAPGEDISALAVPGSAAPAVVLAPTEAPAEPKVVSKSAVPPEQRAEPTGAAQRVEPVRAGPAAAALQGAVGVPGINSAALGASGRAGRRTHVSACAEAGAATWHRH